MMNNSQGASSFFSGLSTLLGRPHPLLHNLSDTTPVLRIAVLGEVRLPGLFPVDPTYTMADLIAAAGGLTPLAANGRISLVRGGTVLEGRIDPQSLTVTTRFQSGDQIVVGKQSWARENLPAFIGAFTAVAVAVITGLLVR